MAFQFTTAIRKIASMRSRVRILQGGSSAGKTIGILACLIDTALVRKGILISVVSETLPHLKKGAIRDFQKIMQDHNYWQRSAWNETTSTYTFPSTGTKIEFFSADSSDKVRGPRRDILFLNEANNLTYETYRQLSIRTNEYIFIDYNPVAEFWVHEEVMAKGKQGVDYDFEILTYKDNEGLPAPIVEDLERYKDHKFFWQVYGLGQIGESEGKIYRGWGFIDEIPHEARLERYGLDFGYTIDPTVIIAIYYYNGGYIIDEVIYQKGLSNKSIADTFENETKALVIADSAEPKSIDEIRSYGVSILGSQKGPGSVLQGIQKVQGLRISVTNRSTKTIKAYRNYMFMKDRDGKVINEPDDSVHEWSNPMDALRYAFESLITMQPILRGRSQPKTYVGGDPVTGFGRRRTSRRSRGIDHLE